MFRQLIALGYIRIDMERHGALRLTEKCRPILRGEQKLGLRKQTQEEKTTKESVQKTTVRPQDQLLWEALRSLRLKLAEKYSVPPYVIFHDATLQEMVRKRPNSPDGMLRMSGIGEQKLQRYGQQFLSEIAKYSLPALLNNNLSKTINETLMLYQQKYSIEKIAKQRDKNIDTIYTHLADAIEIGLIDVRDVIELDDGAYDEIVYAIETMEDKDKNRLKPLYEALNQDYDYGVLRCVQASI